MGDKTCETCMWWDQVKTHGGVPNHNVCTNPKLTDVWGDIADADDDGLSYEYDEGGYQTTGPDFGCIHHEHTPEEPAGE